MGLSAEKLKMSYFTPAMVMADSMFVLKSGSSAEEKDERNPKLLAKLNQFAKYGSTCQDVSSWIPFAQMLISARLPFTPTCWCQAKSTGLAEQCCLYLTQDK